MMAMRYRDDVIAKNVVTNGILSICGCGPGIQEPNSQYRPSVDVDPVYKSYKYAIPPFTR